MTLTTPPSGFRPIAHLGRGGTADVYRAFSEHLGREVALKTPLPLSEQSDLASFAALVGRERKLIGGRRFPGLVRLLDSGDNPPFIAMEICSGPTLDTLGRVDSLPLALNLLSALALDLAYLRAAGIVHGDLKPQNIFLPINYRELADSRLFWLKLSDFSLGRRTDEADSERVGLGTVGYIAPETIVNGTADHQSDLFALGAIAYQMLAGVHPFMEGETDPVTINSRCREEEPTPLDQMRPEVGEGIGRLVSALLQKEPSNRPVSAWEVCLELERLGAVYPFRMALSPVHLMVSGVGYEDAVGHVPVAWGDYADYLRVISFGSATGLRLVLGENFRRGNLRYDGTQFRFEQRPYWPCRLRCNALTTLASSPLSEKKALVRAAVCNEVAAADPQRAATCMLLRPLLRPATIRRISAVMAPRAEVEEQQALATLLAVQAGDLERAERCCYQAAVLLQKEHAAGEALRLLELVIDFARVTGRVFEVVSLVKMKGDCLRMVGEAEAAHSVYLHAVELYDGRPADYRLGRIYNSLGDILRIRQRFAEGIGALQKALVIYEEIGDELELSHTYNNIGNMHFIAGERMKAMHHYRQALRIQRRLKATAEVASTLSNIGAALGSTGRYTRAIRITEVSLKLKRESGDLNEIAFTLNNLGYLHSLGGNKGRAIEALTESLELNRKIGNRKSTLFNLENLAGVAMAAGNLKDTLTYLNEGTELANLLNDAPHQVMFNRLAAVALRRLGRVGESVRRQQEAERLIAAIDDREERVRLAINAASLRAAVGDQAMAISLSQHAAEEALNIGCKPELLNAYLLLTRISLNPEVRDRALGLCQELNLDRERILVLANELHLLVADGSTEQARPIVGEIGPKIQVLRDDLELPRLLLGLAEWKMATGGAEQARRITGQALALARESSLLPEQVQSLTLLSRLQGIVGDYEEAFAASREALQMCKKIAEGITDTEDRLRYQETPLVQSLVKEIRSLKARIGQKRGAGM